jgi:hypothetical protein
MAKKGKLLSRAQQHLDGREQVLGSIKGVYDTSSPDFLARLGIWIATDRRLVFYAKRLARYELESFPYSDISSLEQRPAAAGRSLKFIAYGREVWMRSITDKEFPDFIETLRGKMPST